MLRSQQRLRSEAHNACIEKVNKIALRANDDRIKTPDGVTTYPYGYGC